MISRQIHSFISVAEHLNFTEAAKKLFITQSAVSHQIADLEQHLGVKLFIRGQPSVQLTEAGNLLFKDAKEIIAKCDEAVKKIHSIQIKNTRGILQIGMLGGYEKVFLPSAIKRHRQTHPNIDLNLNVLGWKEINDSLIQEKLDIIFTLSMDLPAHPDIFWKNIWQDNHSIVLHQDHPLANKTAINIALLKEESFVCMNRQSSPAPFTWLLKLCVPYGFRPNIIRQATRIEDILFFIESGIGIGILPHHLKMFASPAVRFIDIGTDTNSSDSQINLVVAWMKTNTNPAIQTFLGLLETEHPFDKLNFIARSAALDHSVHACATPRKILNQ